VINTIVFPIVRQDFILHALKSLRATTPPNYKTIVVNQTVPNREFEEALYELADIIIRTHLNYGFAQAANMGARLAPTEYVTIANDDVEFLPGWWEGIVETFERFPKAMAVSPMSPKEPGWGYGEEGFREHLTLEESRSPENIQALKEQWNGAVVDAIAMWLVVFKHKEWVELGMFDERFTPGGGEDYDADARIYQAGHRALASSLSWVYHHWGQSKDKPNGLSTALPRARPSWNKLSGPEGLWEPDCDVWGRNCRRKDPIVWRAPL